MPQGPRAIRVLFLGLLATNFAHAQDTQATASKAQRNDCLAHHLSQGLSLHRKRQPVYSMQSGGASTLESWRLIAFHFLGKPFAWYLDLKANPWQRKGVPVLCALVETPFPLTQTIPQRKTNLAPLAPFKKSNAPAIARALRAAYGSTGFKGVADEARDQLKLIAKDPLRHCLLRHYLQSILRAALLAPEHDDMALARALPSTRRFSWNFIDWHLSFLDQVSSIDQGAAPLQADGVAFLCQDLPRIPVAKATR
jgi:hypothetical protein